MKRSILTIIAAAAVLGIAACDGAEEETDTNPAEQTAPAAPPAPADAPMDTMSVNRDTVRPDTLHTTTHL